MNKKLLLVLACFHSFLVLQAQVKQGAEKLKFHTINQLGLVQGQRPAAFQLQSVSGLQYKSWFAGIGVGLDNYQYNTLPVFFDLRKYIGHPLHPFFVFADAGVNYVRDKTQSFSVYKFSSRPGGYGTAGIGYATAINKKMAMVGSVGYGFKRVLEKSQYNYIDCGIIGPCRIYDETVTHDFTRIVLQLGLIF